MIIWLASYPRSGNTFFRLLAKHVYGLPTYSIYPEGDLTGAEAKTEMSIDDMAASHDTYFVKTHNMPQEDFPAIYLVRDGRDALVSYTHFVLHYERKLPENALVEQFYDGLRMLIEQEHHFGRWGEHVLAWTGRSTRTVVVKFEELVKAPIECFQNAMAEVGYQPREILSSSIPTFSELHEKAPSFFREGKSGSWRERMPEDLHALFWMRHGETMQKMGYGEDQSYQNILENGLRKHFKDIDRIKAVQEAAIKDMKIQNQTLLQVISQQREELDRLKAVQEAAIKDMKIQNQTLLQVTSEQREELNRLAKIENSWGWKLILRLNHLRSRIIPPGTPFERTYLSVRNTLLGKD